MLHSSSITARVNRKILGVTNTGDNRRNRGGAGTHAETPRTDMYRLKETEGARRPPRARQRHRSFTKGLFKKNLKKPTHSVQPSHPRTGKTPRGSFSHIATHRL